MTRTIVQVPLAHHAYDVVIGAGLLAQLPQLLAIRCPARHYAVISDSTVARHYAHAVRSALAGLGPVTVIEFPPGEASKTRETWTRLTDELLAAGLQRDGAILALGGGVTGDLAGFVAATYLRGVPCAQLPTTLLAMVDSSVGGKTGVDTSRGKNLVGAFHQPRAVVADVATLASLPERHLAFGLAEAIKHAAIADPAHLDQLSAWRDSIRQRDPGVLIELVRRSVEIKAGVVAEDEREHGRRAVLNFGHTVAHAIEAASDYRVPHGEAVAMGMVAEAAIGHRLGVTPAAVGERLAGVLARFDLPTRLPDRPDPARWMTAMRADKKGRAGSVRFALLRDLGQPARGADGAWTVEAADDLVGTVLTELR